MRAVYRSSQTPCVVIVSKKIMTKGEAIHADTA